MCTSPVTIEGNVRLTPRTQIGSCVASLRAKSRVFSNPHAGTRQAIGRGPISTANFLPLNSRLRKSSHDLGSCSALNESLLKAEAMIRVYGAIILLFFG